jgi:hypothetical protein
MLTRTITVPVLAPDGPNWPVVAGAVALLPLLDATLLGWNGALTELARPATLAAP